VLKTVLFVVCKIMSEESDGKSENVDSLEDGK